MDTMFDTLLQLPLFQGLGQEDLTHILGKVKFHFAKHKGHTLLAQSLTPCSQLLFLLKGEVTATTVASDGLYNVTEYFQAPYLIEPQSLFGMETHYVATYHSCGEAHTVTIDKSFAMNELFKYDIFCLNYLNILSNRAQVLNRRVWNHNYHCISSEERILRFIRLHLERPSAGRKEIKIRMEDLAQIVNDTRTGISKTLNNMQAQGKIELRRGEIIIPDAALLGI
ncbi:MAG: Crp/Fnr family transcriptional regulator [Bacteroides sp.]